MDRNDQADELGCSKEKGIMKNLEAGGNETGFVNETQDHLQ